VMLHDPRRPTLNRQRLLDLLAGDLLQVPCDPGKLLRVLQPILREVLLHPCDGEVDDLIGNPGAIEHVAGGSSLDLGRELLADFVVHQSFNRDALVAASLGAAVNLTPLFEPMIARHAARPVRAGESALSILVPNLATLPWEAVIELREHHGAQEAREALRGFDERAATGEAGEAHDYLARVRDQVMAGFFEAFKAQQRSLPEELAKEALKTGVAVVPGVGPIAVQAATLAQLVRDDRRQRGSWVTAIMRMRDWER
jgi:hypothetical protein